MTTRSEVYGTRPVRRIRRTKAQLAELQEAIIEVCAEDHPLTVRGVFYRVMSAGAVDKTERAYGAVQREVLKLRRAGALPYSWIADGTRWQVKPTTWTDLDEMLDDAAASYRRALWHDQDAYVELWAEKDAITSIIHSVTDRWDVPIMVARGYPSESFLWSAGQTINEVNRPTFIYQLGDHDPSGVDAWRATQAKLREFAPGADLTFERLAVTPEQIDEYNLPTRPTKQSDTRSRAWGGGNSVEVDAIPARLLRQIVGDAITSHIDAEAWRLTQIAERSERDILTSMIGGAA